MRNLHTADRQSNRKRQGRRFVAFSLVTLLFCVFFCVTGIDKKMTILADTETEEESSESSSDSGITKKVTVSNSQFDIDLSYGIDGYAVYYCPIPISVDITSSEDFNGVVAVQMLSDADSYSLYSTEYVQDVSLAAGTENTVNLTVYSSGSQRIKLQIRDEDGDVLYEEKDTLSLKTAGNALAIGILSDDFNGLNYFDGVTASIGTYSGLVTTLELNEATLSEDADSLEIMDYMIIDNYDTSRLNDKQYDALKKWVNNGGILICALGANYQNVLHIFDDDFVTGSFGSLGKKDITFGEGSDLTGDFSEVFLSDIDTIDFQFDDSTVVNTLSNNDTAYSKKIGSGAVVMLAYSLCMEPIAGSDLREDIAENVITYAAVADKTASQIGRYANNYYYSISRVVESFYDIDRTDFSFFLIIFIVYILIVGPLIYILLKKTKKRELIWLAIPVTALIFTAVVLVTGNQTKIKKPIVSSLSLTELDGDTASEKIYSEILCPEAKDYDIKFLDSCYSVHGEDEDYYYGYYDGEDYDIPVSLSVNNTSNGTMLSYTNNEIFYSDSVTMDRIKENNIGSIDADIDVYTDGMEGTITNNTCYDFSSLFITEGNSYLIIDELKAGETVDITRDMFDTNNNIWTFLDSYYQSSNYYDDPEYLVNDYVYESLDCGDEDGHVYIWAITDYFESITDSDVSEYGGSVFYTDFYKTYVDYPGFYTSDVNNYLSSSDGDFSLDDNYIYNENATIRYQFDEEVVRLTNISMQSGEGYDSYTGVEYAQVYAYNYSTGAFEQIFADDYVLDGNDLKNYMSDNCMTLRYIGPDTTIPTISAEGEGND